MAQKKSYSRYFIILQEDEKGYSLASDKIASGYAKLETKNDKCKISYYVQNLKKEKTPYYMMLICNKKGIKNIIKIGEMNIDDYGRADTFYEYNINDVAGSGISMDKVSGAAIVRMLDNNIIPVMSGFSSTEIPNWRSFGLIESKENETENYIEQDENKINQDEVDEVDKADKNEVVERLPEDNEKSIFDKYEESIERAKGDREKDEMERDNEEDKQLLEEVESDGDKEDNQKSKEVFAEEEEEEPISEDVFELKDPKDLKDENAALREEPQENCPCVENCCKESKASDNKCEDECINRSYLRNSQGNFFNKLVHGFKEIKNLNKELKRCKWYKVPTASIEDMYNMDDYSRYALVYHPMIGYYPYIKKHLHYITGYKLDNNNRVKYLIYGIPGTNSKKDQPYGGKSGFVTWIPKEGKDRMGYWLMFYDFKTNTIVIPVKK